MKLADGRDDAFRDSKKVSVKVKGTVEGKNVNVGLASRRSN